MACKTPIVVASMLILMLLVSFDEVQGKCREERIKLSCDNWVKCFEWCRLFGGTKGYCDKGSCVCVNCFVQSSGHHSTEVPPPNSAHLE
uniref:Knottin scorpion toxin-like domain-containing protein n=1 Tax=Aegilops tauschii subsp. strangulata TaxID=200361 RepID=A0A453L6Q1_AEGTS